MNRVDFDKAMAANDIATLIENTFLARVPALVVAGMPIEEAIRTAYEHEQILCARMIGPTGVWIEPVAEMREALTQAVYQRARATETEPAVNARWLECERTLGRRPTAHEFIMWHHRENAK